MDDGFGVAEPPPPAPHSVRRPKGGSETSSIASDKTRAKLCDCEEECKQGRRRCSHHNRRLDNCRNQVSKKAGPEGLKNWTEKCRNMEFANSQIEYMAKRSVGLAVFSRAPLIDFTHWEQQFGSLVEKKNASQNRPFQEPRWMLRQVKKFGRDEKAMSRSWRALGKRDHLGYQGQVPLSLPAVEFEERSSAQFIRGAAVEASKGKKRPKEFELLCGRSWLRPWSLFLQWRRRRCGRSW